MSPRIISRYFLILDAMIVFYCRTCKKVVKDPEKKPGKYEYICPECKGENVSFGTDKAVADFFQVKVSGV